MMKILIINYEYPPLGAGAGKQSQLLAEELSKRYKVYVLTSYIEGLKKKEKVNSNLEVLRINVGRKLYHKAFLLEFILFIIFGFTYGLRLARKEKIDITLAFFTVPSGIVAYGLKIFIKIPFIVSLRGFDVPGFCVQEFGFIQKLTGLFIKMVLMNAKFVVSNGVYLQQLIIKFAGEIDIKIIPNAVRQNLITKITPDRQKVNETVKILTVCRLTSQKRVGELINVINMLKTDLKYRLDIIGDGPLKEKLILQTKASQAEKKIFFHGWQDRNIVSKYYQESDILVLFSLEEGMSNVLLEAISAGLPILAMDVESNRSIVRDGVNGFLIPPNDQALAVHKLLMLMEDFKLREKFSINSLKISKRFTPEEMAKNFEALIRAVVKEEFVRYNHKLN